MSKELSQDEVELHNKFYNEATQLIKNHLLLHERQQMPKPGFWDRRKLNRAIKLFQKVIEINPDNWQAMWITGKVQQRLDDHEQAFQCFVKAWDLEPNNADVAREAALTAMNLGYTEEAIKYCNEALRVEPGEAGLLGNFALALLHAGRGVEALQQAEEALAANPSDKVNENVLKAIRHIVATHAPCPKNADELDRYCQTHRKIFR
jgi:tetratricopeptide (TPR) repeat protein